VGKNFYNIPVIYYHSVGPINPEWSRNYLTLELQYVTDQFRYFAKNFNSISLREYYEIKNGLIKPVQNPVVITFDDGYLDNWIWAFPLLKKFKLKATIFVCPEFVDLENGIRPDSTDLKQGKATLEDINRNGYLSWEEMRLMEQSGLVDIQSHTMTHTKYFVSDRLIDFHHPGADVINIIGNLYPDRKSYSIDNLNFEKLIPYGYPLFEEASSIIARKVIINNNFTNECIGLLKDYDFENYNFMEAFKIVKQFYESSHSKGDIITSVESEQEYERRIEFEIRESKKIIEKNLGKKVEFLCWPHGDNNERAHQVALKEGYLATTAGSKQKITDSQDRIPERIGLFHSRNNRLLSRLKMRYKINSYLGKFPYSMLRKTYQYIMYSNSPITR
jgi:hypothetical protein